MNANVSEIQDAQSDYKLDTSEATQNKNNLKHIKIAGNCWIYIVHVLVIHVFTAK